MSDLLEAIQNFSISLSERIGRLAGRRGWAHKPYFWINAERDRFIQIVGTTVSFPGGFYASFTPRSSPDDGVWWIDVRRTDGVVRASWSGGLRVERADRGFALLGRSGPLSDDHLEEMLDAIAAA